MDEISYTFIKLIKKMLLEAINKGNQIA